MPNNIERQTGLDAVTASPMQPGVSLPEPTVGTESNSGLVVGWLEDGKARGMAASTLKNYRSSINGFAAWLGPGSLLGVGHRDLRAYFQHVQAARTLSPRSLGPRCAALASLYEYLSAEGLVEANVVPSFRRRYLSLGLREANKRRFERRPCPTLVEMRRLVRSLGDVQERLLVVLAAKTGVRPGELVAIDVEDIDWKAQAIRLKPHRKRTHLLAFFDGEVQRLLRRWLAVREAWTEGAGGPLFLGASGRLTARRAGVIVARGARRVGLYKPGGAAPERFTLHACRHWFTTHLHRAGMAREHIKVLRGDALPDSMDIYLHIDYRDLRSEYLRCIPQVAGGSRRVPERSRERRARNPSFGSLTPQEASRHAGWQPKKATIELRQRIARDLAAGRLKRPADYARWGQSRTRQDVLTVGRLVSRQLRILGVPSLRKGPRGKGWTVARKQIRDRLRATWQA